MKLKGIKILELSTSGTLYAYTGDVKIQFNGVSGGDIQMIKPELVDFDNGNELSEPGYYDIDGNYINKEDMVDPADWLLEQLHPDIKCVTMDDGGSWWGWFGDVPVYDKGMWLNNDVAPICLSGIIQTKRDPFTARWAKFIRDANGRWVRDPSLT